MNDYATKNDSDTNEDEIKEFVKMGRTGRRNAVADFKLDQNLTLSTVSITNLILTIDCNDDNRSDSPHNHHHHHHHDDKNNANTINNNKKSTLRGDSNNQTIENSNKKNNNTDNG